MMCKKKRELWKITSKELPTVKRNCPKCKSKREFINSGKFRVNANGKNIDVWLIFRCGLCSATWNMTVYERKRADSFDPGEYRGFLENDPYLAEAYGRNAELFSSNKALALLEEKAYTVDKWESDREQKEKEVQEIELMVPFPMALRVDSLLADQLGISRSALKKQCREGDIFELETIENEKTEKAEAIAREQPENKSCPRALKGSHENIGRERVRTGLVIGIRHRP